MRLKGGTTSRVETTTFEQFAKANKFDGIAMNPPYGKGGKTAMEHLAKAFEHLYDGGRVIAIVPDGPAFNKRFDEWYGSNEAKHAIVMKTIRLPQCTFKRAGTSAATKILVIDKYLTDEDMKQAQGGNEVDLRGIENIKDLFSRIKNMTMPERIGADIKNHFTNTVNKKSINSSYMALVDDVKLMNDDRLYALALDYRGARNLKFGGYGFATESLRNKFERTANKYLAEKANNPNAKVPTTESKPAENTESEQHFTLGTHEDTRPNVDKLYSTARPTEYLGDKYRSISNLAKEHNGHYSKYANNSFIFENENDRNEFVKAADALLAESKLSAKGRADDILNNIQPIATAELTHQERALVALGEKMGVPVKFFTGVSRLNGFHSNGMTFINRNGFKSINWTFWHETLHWLKNNNKALYDEIIREIKAKQAFTKEQLDAYRKSIGRNMSDDETIEEMVADKMPDVYSRVKLFKDLANENPTLCQRLLAWVRHTLDKLKEIISADKKKAGLNAKQVDAMIEAFTRLAGDLRSSDGKKLVEKINKGKDIRIVDSKDNVLYPIDNLKNKTYNAGESLTDAQKTTLFNSIQTRIDDHIANEEQSGKSIDDICAELTSDHSAHREGIINRYKTQYKLFLAHRNDSDFKREQIDRIYPANKIADKDVDKVYNGFLNSLKGVADYAGILYREIALDRRGNNGRGDKVFHWESAERQRAERERQQNNNKFSVSRSDKDGFSNVRYSLSESEKAGTVDSFKKATKNLLKVKTESNVTDKYSEKQEKKKETPDGKLPKSFIVQSMHHLAKSSEHIKRIYNLATKAMEEQEKLRNGFKKSIDKVYRLTKDSKDRESINQIYSSII